MMNGQHKKLERKTCEAEGKNITNGTRTLPVHRRMSKKPSIRLEGIHNSYNINRCHRLGEKEREMGGETVLGGVNVVNNNNDE